MSHSISANYPYAPEEVAHIDFNVSERERSFLFYIALDATEFDGGCSGLGTGKLISGAKMKEALEIYERCAPTECKDEIEFFRACAQHDDVFVWFS